MKQNKTRFCHLKCSTCSFTLTYGHYFLHLRCIDCGSVQQKHGDTHVLQDGYNNMHIVYILHYKTIRLLKKKAINQYILHIE